MDSEEKRFLESVREDVADITEGDSQQKSIYFIIGLSLATVLVSVFVLALSLSKNAQISSLDVQIEEQVNVPLKNLKEETRQVTSISVQLDVLNTVLSSRIRYPQIIKDLATNTFKQSRWTSTDYQEGRVVITGSADDFIGVSKVVSAFENTKSVKTVNLTSVNIDSQNSSIEYTVELEVDESSYKFLAKTQASTNLNGLEGNAGTK